MNNKTIKADVAFWHEKNFQGYPKKAPFHPSISYPEYNGDISDEVNNIYDAVRNNFKLLNYDMEHYGTSKWNPLKHIIKKGDTVLIKPNFVIHENEGIGSIWSVITHPSVIRAVIDYVYIALEGIGKVIIADAPQADADFNKILEISQLYEIVEYYKKKYDFIIEVYDLRQLKFEYKDNVLLSDSRIELAGDPLGYTIFDLKEKSNFIDIANPQKLYGADYDRSETKKHHQNGKHEYCIANSVLNADVIISLPKMKTHRKAGVTLNLKNFVGINGNKNYLPHFRIGEVKDGGDEYPTLNSRTKVIKYSNRFFIDNLLVKPNKFKSLLYNIILKSYKGYKSIFYKSNKPQNCINGGGWYGNDTLWRMILDLNTIVLYGTSKGEISSIKQRKFFSIIDGMIGGEGNGPLAAQDKKCGVIIMGEDLISTDLVAIKLMGIDYMKVKVYEQLLSKNIEKMCSLEVKTNYHKHLRLDDEWEENFEFLEPEGWEKHLKFKKSDI